MERWISVVIRVNPEPLQWKRFWRELWETDLNGIGRAGTGTVPCWREWPVSEGGRKSYSRSVRLTEVESFFGQNINMNRNVFPFKLSSMQCHLILKTGLRRTLDLCNCCLLGGIHSSMFSFSKSTLRGTGAWPRAECRRAVRMSVRSFLASGQLSA